MRKQLLPEKCCIARQCMGFTSSRCFLLMWGTGTIVFAAGQSTPALKNGVDFQRYLYYGLVSSA
jgi:hypothetical protein